MQRESDFGGGKHLFSKFPTAGLTKSNLTRLPQQKRRTTKPTELEGILQNTIHLLIIHFRACTFLRDGGGGWNLAEKIEM